MCVWVKKERKQERQNERQKLCNKKNNITSKNKTERADDVEAEKRDSPDKTVNDV